MSLLPRGTVATLLAPLQLGIGTSNGVESALHLVQSHIDHNPTDVVLSLDIANGFNSLYRHVMPDNLYSCGHLHGI